MEKKTKSTVNAKDVEGEKFIDPLGTEKFFRGFYRTVDDLATPNTALSDITDYNATYYTADPQ
jgi:hypothetical protein